jgi:hypothetical protein
MIMNSVENIVFNPALDNQYYNTPLNCWYCDPFFMYSTNDQETLLNDLANQSVGNFFFDGHGSEETIGSALDDSQHASGLSMLSNTDVGVRLGNYPPIGRKKGQKYAHPYHLAILNACDCGGATYWAQAFGITTGLHSTEWFQNHGESPQAMVAWTGDTYGPNGFDVYGQYEDYGEHLAELFGLWMSEAPLDYCVGEATVPDSSIFPDHPLDLNWTIFGDPVLTRSPQ